MFIVIYLFTFIHFGASVKMHPKINRKKLYLKEEYSEACELCKNCFNGVSSMLEDGFSDDEIKASLLSVCNIYPEKYSEICNELGTTYFPILLHLAHELSSESKNCIKLGYCSDLENRI
mgnify:FL=1